MKHEIAVISGSLIMLLLSKGQRDILSYCPLQYAMDRKGDVTVILSVTVFDAR